MKVPLLIYLFTQLDYIITMPESARPHSFESVFDDVTGCSE